MKMSDVLHGCIGALLVLLVVVLFCLPVILISLIGNYFHWNDTTEIIMAICFYFGVFGFVVGGFTWDKRE